MNLPCPRTVSISEFRIQFKFKLNFTWHNARHSVPQNWPPKILPLLLRQCRFVNAALSMPLRQCSLDEAAFWVLFDTHTNVFSTHLWSF